MKGKIHIYTQLLTTQLSRFSLGLTLCEALFSQCFLGIYFFLFLTNTPKKFNKSTIFYVNMMLKDTALKNTYFWFCVEFEPFRCQKLCIKLRKSIQ